MPFVFELKEKSAASIIPFSCKGGEITSEIEVRHSDKKNNDEEQFRMVVKRMANAIWVDSFSCVRRRPTLARTVDTAKTQW